MGIQNITNMIYYCNRKIHGSLGFTKETKYWHLYSFEIVSVQIIRQIFGFIWVKFKHIHEGSFKGCK